MQTKIIAGIFVLIILIFAGLYLFSQIQEKEAFKNVEIDFESVEIKNIDLQQMTLNLKCHNPDKITATLDGADYEIYLEGIYMGNGSLNERLTILSNETKIVRSEVNVKYENLNQLLNITDEIVKNNGEVDILIKGKAYIEFIGKINFQFKVEKKINLSKEIVEKIKDLKNFKIF